MRPLIVSFALALFGGSLASSQSVAQSRDRLPIIVPDPDTKSPNDAARPGSGANGGLPDAVTVLDILSRLPRFPPRGDSGTTDDTTPPFGPMPQSTGATAPPSRRVVTIPPNAPFKPSPRPRQTGAAAALVGAVGPQARDREVVVALGASAGPDTASEIAQSLGLDGQTLYSSALLGQRIVSFRISDTRSVADVVQQLSTDARVDAVQPNYAFFSSQGAAKPLPAPQYAPAALNLERAHKIALGKRVRIAVIDTAVDAMHPALKGAITGSFDALGENALEAEPHGTAIAGIVGARFEITGVAPAAEILSVRAFAKSAAGPAQSHTMALLRGLDWAVQKDARVINMSFAGPDDPLLQRAIEAAVKRGVVVIAAAGNGGPDAAPAYPGAFPSVIGVTATDARGAPYAAANRGPYIAVAAPGVDIIAAAPNGAYDISSGTSLAAAHVSGVAALMLEQNPKLTPAEIRDHLKRSAHAPDSGANSDLGAGIVDAEGALLVK